MDESGNNLAERLARIEELLLRHDRRHTTLVENVNRLAEAHMTIAKSQVPMNEAVLRHLNRFSGEWDSLFKTTQELVNHTAIVTARLVEAFNLPETKSVRAAAKAAVAEEKPPETITALKH